MTLAVRDYLEYLATYLFAEGPPVLLSTFEYRPGWQGRNGFAKQRGLVDLTRP